MRDILQYSFALIDPPLEEPLSLQDLREQSRIGGTADSVLLMSYLTAVRQMVETNNSMAIMTQTWDMQMDCFPKVIKIYKRPIQLIVHIKYRDEAGTEQTLDPSQYIADVKNLQPMIVPAPGVSWPAVPYRPDAVKVRFKAGYGDTPESVPEHVRQYLRIKVADFYEHRESVVQGPSLQTLSFVEHLISSERLQAL